MKVGDIVYCKKSLTSLIQFKKKEIQDTYFEVGNNYRIKKITKTDVVIFFAAGWTTFTFEKHPKWEKFDEYFYTNKELRNLKLNKIEKL